MKKTGSQITVNQHVVPQTHLKRFRILNHPQQKLECLNVDALRIEKPQSTKSICSADFHYAQYAGVYDEYSQIVENAFSNIEDWYSKNIDRIENELLSKQSLSSDDRYKIACVVSNFYFRGFKFRDETQKAISEVTDWLKPDLVKTVKEDVLKTVKKISGTEIESIASDVVDKTLDSYANDTSYSTRVAFDKKFANLLTNKKWEILINNSVNYSFVTGDEAVIEIQDSTYPQNLIFANGFPLRIQIFHLSAKIAIIMSYPKIEGKRGQTVFEIVTNNKAKIFKNNLFYVNHTYKYCYGPEKTFFEELIAYETNGTFPEIFK